MAAGCLKIINGNTWNSRQTPVSEQNANKSLFEVWPITSHAVHTPHKQYNRSPIFFRTDEKYVYWNNLQKERLNYTWYCLIKIVRHSFALKNRKSKSSTCSCELSRHVAVECTCPRQETDASCGSTSPDNTGLRAQALGASSAGLVPDLNIWYRQPPMNLCSTFRFSVDISSVYLLVSGLLS